MEFNDPRTNYFKQIPKKTGQQNKEGSGAYWVKADSGSEAKQSIIPGPLPRAVETPVPTQQVQKAPGMSQHTGSHQAGRPQDGPSHQRRPDQHTGGGHQPYRGSNQGNRGDGQYQGNRQGGKGGYQHGPKHKDEDLKPPQFSQLRKNLGAFYFSYFESEDFDRMAVPELSRLRKWMEDYTKQIQGRADIKFNMKPFVVSQECDIVHEKFWNKWSTFPDRWQRLFEVIEEVGAHPVFRIGVLQSIKKFKTDLHKEPEVLADIQRRMHKIGQRGWYSISCDHLENYLDAFEVLPIDKPEDVKFVRQECDNLWGARRYFDLAVMIRCFDLYQHYDCLWIVESIVRDDKVAEAIRFVGKRKDLAQKAIKSMDSFKHSSEARQLIRKFEFDPISFPHIYFKQAQLAIRSLVTRLGWKLAEEKLMTESKKLLEVLIHVLWDQKLFNEAMSVQQRYQVDLARDLKPQKNLPAFALVSNDLLSKDNFMPTEVYLEGKKLEDYLTLADFGVKESDVKFLDKIDDNFREITEKFLTAKMVGVDSEFCGDLVGYEPSTVATLQLASEDTVAIIDFMKIQKAPEVYQFCKKLFEDPNIQKVGHTFSSDVGVLRASFQNQPIDFVNVINIDEAFVVKGQKLGLAKIVKEVFNKELSKFNQQSNWKKRPLRRGQIHYAALDAVSVLHLLKKTREDQDPRVEGLESETYFQSETSSEGGAKQPLLFNEKAIRAGVASKKEFKYLVDGMLKKLAVNLRNIGRDALIVPDGLKPSELIQLAAAEDRLILTRDKKVIQANKSQPLIRISSSNPFAQLQQLVMTLRLVITKKDFIKRCTKCNSADLPLISKEEAMKVLEWENPDSIETKEFWQCAGCKQIYWEGGNFLPSMKMFDLLMKDSQAVLGDIPEKPEQEPTEEGDAEEPSQGANVEEEMLA